MLASMQPKHVRTTDGQWRLLGVPVHHGAKTEGGSEGGNEEKGELGDGEGEGGEGGGDGEEGPQIEVRIMKKTTAKGADDWLSKQRLGRAESLVEGCGVFAGAGSGPGLEVLYEPKPGLGEDVRAISHIRRTPTTTQFGSGGHLEVTVLAATLIYTPPPPASLRGGGRGGEDAGTALISDIEGTLGGTTPDPSSPHPHQQVRRPSVEVSIELIR